MKSFAPFAYYDHNTSCWRTSEGSLLQSLDDSSDVFSGRWPSAGTMRNGVCSPRPMSARSTEESESGLWPTANVAGGGNPPDRLTKIGNQYFRPSGEKAHLGLDQAADMWATPRAEDGERGQGSTFDGLMEEARDWATPQAGDEKAAVNVTTQNQRMLSHDALAFSRGPTPSPFADMTTPSGVSRVTRRKMGLNPEFTRWLMGYPLAWLSCVASATPSSRSARTKSSATSKRATDG